MLASSDTSIETALAILASFDVDAALFVPTHTALDKSIIDAHASFRALLKRRNIHDFSSQLQGSANKVELPITLISGKAIEHSKISLYRPETKNGDPRFWISKLNKLSIPNNLWALFELPDKRLFAVNFSSDELHETANDPQELLGAILELNRDSKRNKVAEELLEKLISIHDLGYVQTHKVGDTGVGFTLESLLGIKANSSKTPDYKGIELKAKRPNMGNRVNLFSMVPDWKRSPISDAKSLLLTHGYWDQIRNRQALYVTLNSTPNAQGLYLEVDENLDNLNTTKKGADGKRSPVVLWGLSALKSALVAKHSETFWVTASKRTNQSCLEEFLYRSVIHTKAPLVDYIPTLIEANIITLDFTLHLKSNGKSRDHGYLFKIKPEKLGLLFPDPVSYDLSKLSLKGTK